MQRVARLACPIFIAALLHAAPSAAQAPAVDQYTGPGLSAGLTLRLSVGPASVSAQVQVEIDLALRQAGIVPGGTAAVVTKDVKRFLDSPIARRLSSGDAEDVGRAVGRLIVDPAPATAAVLQELIGYAPVLGDATHAVFTRGRAATGEVAAFEKGVVAGSDAVPRAYVEMSSAKRSFVKAFDALGVSTVDDIDTASGKAALVAILVSGAEGNFGSKATADAKLVDGEVRPLSATVGDSGGAPLSYLLLAIVFVAFMSVVGLRPRRRRRI